MTTNRFETVNGALQVTVHLDSGHKATYPVEPPPESGHSISLTSLYTEARIARATDPDSLGVECWVHLEDGSELTYRVRCDGKRHTILAASI